MNKKEVFIFNNSMKTTFFGAGRRFLFVWISLAISSVSLFTRLATFSEWASFITWLGGLYIVANVGERVADSVKNSK